MKKSDMEGLDLLGSFLLLLLSGAYLGKRAITNSINRAAAEGRKRNAETERYEQMSDLLADDSLSDETMRYVLDNRDEAIDAVKKDLIEAIGPDWENMRFVGQKRLSFPKRTTRCFYLGYWVVALLMAKNGKVGEYDLLTGIPLGGVKVRDRNMALARRIEFLLRHAGNDIKLVLKPDTENGWNGGYMVFEFLR